MAVLFLIIAVLFPSIFSKSSIVSIPGSDVSVVCATAKLIPPFVYPTKRKKNAAPTNNKISILVFFNHYQ